MLTYTKRTHRKGASTTVEYMVELNGFPFALLAKFTPAHGGNWYVGLANTMVGGRFATRTEAEQFIEGQA